MWRNEAPRLITSPDSLGPSAPLPLGEGLRGRGGGKETDTGANGVEAAYFPPCHIYFKKNTMEEQKKSVVIDGVEYVPKAAELSEDWPKHGDWYCFVTSNNGKRPETFVKGCAADNDRKKAGNCFRTEQEADFEILRRECMATRWVPEGGEFYYAYSVAHKSVVNAPSIYSVFMGIAALTKKEAQARWNKYGDAWLEVLKPKK